MKTCPSCGVFLDAKLVDAITNPSMPESCPHTGSSELHTPVGAGTQ